MARERKQGTGFVLVYMLFLGIACSVPAAARNEVNTLTELSLEELLEVDVTSAARKAEPREESAAAVYVLTEEDIRRSGARSLPDLLRHVPGLSVARLDRNKYAVTVRGFNDRFANKLLVMVDGRSIYTTDFSGVWWDHHDIPLENIARIEVIRGPGGALWGANAVNGVINIQTKAAQQTQGVLLRHIWATDAPLNALARYGGSSGDDLHYRLTLSYADRNEAEFPDGSQAEDHWEDGRFSTRLDWHPDPDTTVTLDGHFFRGRVGQSETLAIMPPPYSIHTKESEDHAGAHIRARLERVVSEDSQWAMQFYCDHTRRDSLQLLLDRTTFDLGFQHQYRIDARNELVWGGNARYSYAGLGDRFWVNFDSNTANDYLLSMFLSYERTMFDDTVKLNLGGKLEFNNYSGFELQPTARLMWRPKDKHVLWAAISRAVRTPSFLESEGHINQLRFPLGLAALTGNQDFEAENLLAYEAGYRYRVTERIAFDLALFENRYDGLRYFGLNMPRLEWSPFPPHLLLPFQASNELEAVARGIEFAADYAPLSWWVLRGSWSLVDVDITDAPGGISIMSDDPEGDTPQQQAALQSRMDLPHHLELDTTLSWFDRLPTFDIDSYWDLEVRLGWRPIEDLDISLVGQHLLDHRRTEYGGRFVNTDATTVERAFYARVEWRF